MKKIALAFLISLFFIAASHATDVDCSSSSTVQTAINNAVNGDTIRCSASGSYNWSSTVTIPAIKGITLNGNGATVAGSISVTQNASTTTRITNFNFTSNNAVTISGSKTSAAFRIDNCVFTGGSTMVTVDGNAPGLIDNNYFGGEGAAEMIHNEGLGSSDASGWSDDITPGSAEFVYIEDNEFVKTDVSGNPAYFWGCSALQSYYGARTVFRYNDLSMAQVDQHGTPGMIGARWWEIYENTFDMVENGNQSSYMQIRAGSGVIFNNYKTGYPNGGYGGIELVEEDSGYPALYQIGRGKGQVLDPAYAWNNNAAMLVGSGSSNVVLDRDYYLSTKPGYTPYTYPHPLRKPTSPANLRIIQ